MLPAAAHPRANERRTIRPPTRAIVRRFHWSIYAGGAVGALLALVFVGPVAVAVVLLRCCDDSRGPTLLAWLVIGLVVAGGMLLAAAAGGLLAWLVRGVMARRA